MPQWRLAEPAQRLADGQQTPELSTRDRARTQGFEIGLPWRLMQAVGAGSAVTLHFDAAGFYQPRQDPM